jgi:hypothetical protein
VCLAAFNPMHELRLTAARVPVFSGASQPPHDDWKTDSRPDACDFDRLAVLRLRPCGERRGDADFAQLLLSEDAGFNAGSACAKRRQTLLALRRGTGGHDEDDPISAACRVRPDRAAAYCCRSCCAIPDSAGRATRIGPRSASTNPATAGRLALRFSTVIE